MPVCSPGMIDADQLRGPDSTLRRFNSCWRRGDELRKRRYGLDFFRMSRTHGPDLARYCFRETVASTNYRLVNDFHHDCQQ